MAFSAPAVSWTNWLGSRLYKRCIGWVIWCKAGIRHAVLASLGILALLIALPNSSVTLATTYPLPGILPLYATRYVDGTASVWPTSMDLNSCLEVDNGSESIM